MSQKAWSSTVGATWDAGVVAGTGVVGAIVHGDPANHIITLGHERFFVPANSRRPAPILADALPAIRGALADHDEARAADIVDARLREQGWDPEQLIWTDPLGPIAQVEWRTSTSKWTDYRREISLTDGSVAVSWRIEPDIRAGLRVNAVHGLEELELELWSDADLEGVLVLAPVTETSAGASTVMPVDYSDRVVFTIASTSDALALRVVADGAEPKTAVSAEVDISAAVATVPGPDGWRIPLLAGRPIRVAVRIECRGGVAARPVALDMPTLLDRSQIALGDSTSTTDQVSLEELWASAFEGDPAAEAALFEVAYAAGRRNVLASTGALPPTLQGVWQGTWAPAWSADYTLNGNLQLGALAGALWTGSPEAVSSLFRLIRPFADDYRSNARRIFGRDGMMLPARLTTHGHANHFLRDYPHEFWLGGGPWLLRMAADYIQVTGDRSPIDDWLWEFALEVLEFCEAVAADGGGNLSPSYSPENTPHGSENPLATNAIADIAALRDGFRVGAWLASLRGDTVQETAWAAARESLPAYRVAADRTLGEWRADWPEHVAHRHASQLQGLWYEPDPVLLIGELREAALATVQAKIAWRAQDPTGPPGNMEMAFGLSSVGLAAAALGDADSAYQCALWLARDHFTAALTTTHDAGGIFNLDASGALPAVVAAMLVGSSAGRIQLLPALPRQWPCGKATGLGVRGGATVSELEWTTTGVRVKLELPPENAWLRPGGVAIVVPRAATLVRGVGIRQVSPTSMHTEIGVSRAEAEFAYVAA